MSNGKSLIIEAAKIYKVLGNTTRLDILYFLRHHKEVNVSTIVNHLSIAQPIVSKHLKILRQFQLVTYRREGTNYYYALNDPHVVEMVDDMLNHVKHEIKGEPHPQK
ncbi:metalloregulator ArsR/SmtB family transcription factor [Limosilactobacillus fermentum]|jgi:DNA-binding transcriptional ArsR family regulator|uniref:ArsR/SmtB family transcription factor n=1 Tax=Lactobacillaceae TaxID=33958 RepID=UPI000C7EC74C|nr:MULTISPECIES: metalloregulator ArsR/SmtB family transcription factor [Lactobacillaceae]KAB1957269.1 helix-turn-helix transcriptional regulator [Limosilactobacillus fermentum]MBC9022645.1 helix-turn-helix transcriptional regulator [Limosilactobacillus fermentum CECT 5716]MCB4716291.1 transcriptional regulator [Limosilactobacillus fermentum]MCH5397774.1 metalloregulator ArsR/SmtB family transcription factor [Limosilactobacillus fermentum]MDQ7190400.1 metalloregulator ArsR/SmtB family transcri